MKNVIHREQSVGSLIGISFDEYYSWSSDMFCVFILNCKHCLNWKTSIWFEIYKYNKIIFCKILKRFDVSMLETMFK